jgi:tumor protein p53-inducible protein 3
LTVRIHLQRPIPEPKAHEVLVKIHYTAINRADTLQRKGAYPAPPGATDILGLELAGEIVSIGAEANKDATLKPGQRVMALLSGGGNAEYATVHAQHLIPIPEAMSYRTAAAIPETWLTAYQLLFLVGQLKRGQGERVLVHAAASGVGTAAVQLAKDAGATVFAVAGSDEKLSAVSKLGAAHVCNYKTADFAAAVKDSVGAVDLILDPVGASFWKQNADALAMDGRWVLYGSMGGLHTEGTLLASILRKRAALLGTTLRNRSDEYKADLVSCFIRDALPKLSKGSFAPIIDSEFELSEVQAAHERMESNANTGKILIKVSE